MILFFESGRLGNQLFQYCAMRKFCPDGSIFAAGMQDLKTGFNGIHLACRANLPMTTERILEWVGERRIEEMAGRGRLLSLVQEVNSPKGVWFDVASGFLRNVFYFKAGYYQSESFLQPEIVRRMTIKPAFIEEARAVLDSFGVRSEDRYFVHVRRGDYLNWPSSDSPAILDAPWYLAQMSRIRKENPKAFFVIISDDQRYTRECFGLERDLAVVGGYPMLDFSVATLCQGGGILSASSFSWWAAYFLRRENSSALLIAPRYWCGHRRGEWHPPSIQTSWLTYAETA
jgi:hypothetical protein